MENTKSPFDTLFGKSLPRLLQAIEERQLAVAMNLLSAMA
jgi:hypothetical protein